MEKIQNGMVGLVRKKSENEDSPDLGFLDGEMRTPIKIVCRKAMHGVCCKVCNAKFLPLTTADENPN
jgi:hypothetical protein